ncbi:hypothetical protein [Chitinophaga lutea]|uniref:hypothetical protein n=1 Tax=Chitinophaga lutea TaxID=2488634 RepID=UPI000F511B7C|nr:hypothetical protein [Chitinophaga lutea]
MKDTITAIAAAYGWTVQQVAATCELYNRAGARVCIVSAKGSRYHFRDTTGTLIYSGTDLARSVEWVLTKYYYTQKIAHANHAKENTSES